MCDIDKFRSLEVYKTMCDDDKVGSLEVYILRVILISLEVWRFAKL